MWVHDFSLLNCSGSNSGQYHERICKFGFNICCLPSLASMKIIKGNGGNIFFFGLAKAKSTTAIKEDYYNVINI